MKVIMLRDVGGVGQRGKVVDVSDGYALNYLIPHKMAEHATADKLAKHAVKQAADAQSAAERDQEWAENAKKLNGAIIVTHAKANASGHLYTQLPGELVIAAIRAAFQIDVPPQALVINAPIKQLGDSPVEIRFGSHKAKLTVRVNAEQK